MSKPKLICFTHVGGTSDFFSPIEEALSEHLDVFKIDYPGHGKKHKEVLCRDFDELLEKLYPEIAGIISDSESSYSLLGYSMGCFAVMSLLKMLKAGDVLPAPERVFLASHEPMHRLTLEDVSDEDLERFTKEETIKFGNVPDKLIGNRTFWRMYLPIYQADYRMIDRFEFCNMPEHMAVPATVFYSESDCPYDKIKQWDKYFDNCRYIQFEGGHFFIKEHYKEMAGIIINDIR